VEAAANGAAAEIWGEVSRFVLAHLRDGVEVTFTVEVSHFGAGAISRNRAKHAWLYDNGSQARHYTTKSGATHDTGAMWGKTPPTHVFVRTVIRKRRQMYERPEGSADAQRSTGFWRCRVTLRRRQRAGREAGRR
jgi:hypothetical protein